MSLIIDPALRPFLERYRAAAPAARPVRVTLRLREGSPVAGYDPPKLDGLLAWAVVQEATGGRGLAPSSAPYALPVPLLCLWRSVDGLPLWAASDLRPAGAALDDVEYLHKRAISGGWSAGNPRTGRLSLNTASGRHMERRVPLPQRACAVWEARAWGDAAEIARLLAGVAFVGKRRGAGLGEVRDWQVESIPAGGGGGEPGADGVAIAPGRDAVCRDGRLLRPVPAGAAGALGLAPDEPPALLGWTPPYWTPASQGPGWAAGAQAGRIL